MTNKFSVAKLIEVRKKEESTPNGNIENVWEFILELEQSGEYPIDNICDLKSAYYRWVNDDKSALYWVEQAVHLAPNNTSYLFSCYRILMDLGEFKKALPVIDKIIELEKEMEVQWHTILCTFAKAICYYYLKDYKNCYHYLKDLDDDFSCWLAGGLHSKAEMMNVLRGFGYNQDCWD